MKSQITERLGHSEVVLPSLIAQGLAANDRAKVRMTALQALVEHARSPLSEIPELTRECRSAGIDSTQIRSVIGGARAARTDVIAAPGLEKLLKALKADVEVMIHAAATADSSEGNAAAQRWSVIEVGWAAANDEIERRQIERLIAISAGESDSVHRLVMDLHKVLNRLAATCAEETIEGAHAHGLGPGDRAIVAAFMRGVNRTRRLKFDHPGLDTTVARQATRLVIQNDIGTTDAHVLIVTVEGMAVDVTHTDIHRSRAKFFVGLFDPFGLQWSGLEREKSDKVAGDDAFFLVNGQYQADTIEKRDAFLEAVGAAVVFLIDWNKARKSLRSMLDNADAIRVLQWAAAHEIGHRAFLELGGQELIASAVRHVAPTRIGFGEQLGTVLGREGAIDFFKAVLRVSTEALLEGRSARLVRDEIEADLIRRLERTDSTLLSMVIRQAGLAREIVNQIAQHIRERQAGCVTDANTIAARARRIEQKADQLVNDARSAIARFDAHPTIAQLVNAMEGAIDELEQAAFVAALLPVDLKPDILTFLGDLCAAVLGGTEAVACGADAAAEVPEGHRADFDDALRATASIRHCEHSADDAERAVTALVLQSELSVGTALAVLDFARALERASDQIAVAGNFLHAHAMADLSA